MNYKIVVDSCCELPEELQGDPRMQTVSLGITLGDYQIMDDENFDQKDFLRRVAASPECPKSSCPPPESFLSAYKTGEERVYVVTLSSPLSGSYNSAVLAGKLYREEGGSAQVHVFDSESASGGETQLVLKIIELEEKGLSFQEIVEQVERYRDTVKTYFVLENLETFRKNGRLTGVKALAVTTLNIKPIMSSRKGQIIQKSQSIGINKALSKLADLLAAEIGDAGDRCLIISHCNAPERAEFVKTLMLERLKFQRVVILDMRGISTMYANDGGVIVTA